MRDLTTEASDKVQDVRSAIEQIYNLAKRQARKEYKEIILDKTFICKCLEFFNNLTQVTYTKLETKHILFWLEEDR